MWIGSPSVCAGISPSTGGRVAIGVDEALITVGVVDAAKLPRPGIAKAIMRNSTGNTVKEVRKLFICFPIKYKLWHSPLYYKTPSELESCNTAMLKVG